MEIPLLPLRPVRPSTPLPPVGSYSCSPFSGICVGISPMLCLNESPDDIVPKKFGFFWVFCRIGGEKTIESASGRDIHNQGRTLNCLVRCWEFLGMSSRVAAQYAFYAKM